MEDARIRAFSRLVGSNIRTALVPIMTSAALFALATPAGAAECQAGSVPGGDVLTAGNDTCVITTASPLTDPIDALGQGSGGVDTLKLNGVPGALSFDATKVGGEFTNFEVVDVAGPVTLTTGAASAIAWNVSAGTLTIANSSALSAATAVTVATGATLTTTLSGYTTAGPLTNHGFVHGNLTANGNVTSDGTMSPGLGAGNVGTMTINGDYASASGTSFGTFEMDVDFSVAPNPGVASDLVHVTGKTSGNTFLDVNATNAGLGIATTGNGILVIQVDGPSSTGVFGMTTPVASGAYQYIPVWVPDFSGTANTADGLFLQSILREEFYGHAALLAGEQAVIRSCFRSDQRIPDATRSRDNVRMWGQGAMASFKTESDVGVTMEDQMYCANGGLDFGIGEGIRFGVVGGYASSSIDVLAGSGASLQIDGSTKVVEALLSIGTPYYFFNATGGYATTDWTYDGTIQSGLEATQSGLIASAQAGATVNVTPFRFKFIGAVNYDQTSCGNDCLLAGMEEDTGIVEAKGTIRIEAMTTQINPYVSVSFSDDLTDGNTISMSGESLNFNSGHSLLSLNGGFNAPIDDGMMIYGDFSVLDGMGNSTSGYSAAAGLKAFW